MRAFMPRTAGGLVRAGLAFGAALLCGWYGYLYLSNHKAIESRVNAERLGVPAQIDGVLAGGLPPRGTEVHRGDVLGIIENPRVDDRSLGELDQLLRVAQDRLVASDALRATLLAEKSELASRDVRHQHLESSRLTAAQAEQTAALDAAIAALDEADSLVRRGRQLRESGDIAQAKLDTLEHARQQAEAETRRLTAAVERAGAELAGAKGGFALTESYSDVPYTRQRLDEINLRLASLQSERAQQAADAESLKIRRGTEAQRISEMRRQVLTSPVDGVVWDVHAPTGGEVLRGATLIDLVDCERVFVEATVHERFLDRIGLDEGATVHLLGAEGSFRGRVRTVLGSAASWDDASKAVVSLRKNPGEARVILDIAGARVANRGRMCDVGRLAEVTFGGAAPDTANSGAAVAQQSGIVP